MEEISFWLLQKKATCFLDKKHANSTSHLTSVSQITYQFWVFILSKGKKVKRKILTDNYYLPIKTNVFPCCYYYFFLHSICIQYFIPRWNKRKTERYSIRHSVWRLQKSLSKQREVNELEANIGSLKLCMCIGSQWCIQHCS